MEEVKNSKGNSEANSIKQALKINERGVYTICAEAKAFYHDLVSLANETAASASLRVNDDQPLTG